ncbi:uncharacterized protein LOC133536867 [Nerophis ophidion]|uniref:uncharacterized protein LOC133536867 n=1 Tax=Nerophis ophidion TaxID=159077 RepID=UPI002ADFCF21|nr:uncharacterized protein LOC133536867 [Nerophis ophidion]
MSYLKFDTSTPLHRSVGRGRGIPFVLQFDSPVQGDVAHVAGGRQVPVEAHSDSGDRVPSQSHHMNTTLNTQVTATPTADPTLQSHDVVSQMSDIIRHVGQQLADSIVTHLGPAHTMLTPSASGVCDTPINTLTQGQDSSQVRQVSHRKVKEPPSFRGDDTDAVDVHEWEDLMRNYVRRSDINMENQAEEMLVHLRGRARDIVKFVMRNSGIDVTKNLDAIYSLLRKHFAAVPCSTLPLADFYTTLPKANEGAYDYWLRLNQAADIAADRLEEQGKNLDCSAIQVTRMFIKNCPSRDLSMTFRSKTIDKWSAVEVQAVLDEYHTELSSKNAAEMSRKPNECVYLNNVDMLHTAVGRSDTKEANMAKGTDQNAFERVIAMLEKFCWSGLLKPVLLWPDHQRHGSPELWVWITRLVLFVVTWLTLHFFTAVGIDSVFSATHLTARGAIVLLRRGSRQLHSRKTD